MGTPKGLVDFHGRPWIVEQIDRARRAGIADIVVTLGYDGGVYEAALANAAVTVVVNSAPERGQFSSLQTGLDALARGSGAFVLPIDVPAAAPAVWRELAAALGPGCSATVPEFENRGGHPVLLSSALIEAIARLPAESRLDEALRTLVGDRKRRVAVTDRSVILNLNDRAAFAEALRTTPAAPRSSS